MNNKTPTNWFLAGSDPQDYKAGVDRIITLPGRQSGFIQSRIDNPHGFGTLMQMCQAEKLKDNKIRMSAYMKTKDVIDWAGMWFRIDGEQNETLGFDNMDDRPLHGDIEWQKFTIVLAVPDKAKNLAFGILLSGKGKVWISDITFEVAPFGTKVTSLIKDQNVLPPRPLNLDFMS